MNFYAQKLGLSYTNYDSPHGLINKNNVSCAVDIAKLLRECMIGGPRRKPRSRIDDFTAFQQMLSDDEPESNKDYSGETKSQQGWVQRIYRKVVGTKRHETQGIVPVEMTAKEIKKQNQKAKKKNGSASPEMGTATVDDLGLEIDDNVPDADGEENVVDSNEPDAADSNLPKIKLKTRKYVWTNTNKLLNVEIDRTKEDL